MQTIFRTIVLFIVFGAGCGAHAESYRYSYEFSTGEMVTGFFDGTPSGDRITDLSNISVSFGSVNFPRNGHLRNWGGYGLLMRPDVAEASFSGLSNQFMFTDKDIYVADYPYLYAFRISAANLDRDAMLAVPSEGLLMYEYSYDAARWHVSLVPEADAYAMLLFGLALLGVAASGRQKRS